MHVFRLMILIFCPCLVMAQKQTFLRYNFGLSIDETQFATNSPNFELFGSTAGTTSLKVEQQLNDLLSLELGLQDRYFAIILRGLSPDTHFILATSNYIDFPIKVMFNQSVDGHFSIQQRIGSTLSLAHTFSGIKTEYTYVNYPIHIYKAFPHFYATASIGLGFSWHFSKTKSWILTSSYDYTIAFKPILDFGLNDPTKIEYAHVKASGNHHIILLGIGYRISNFWQKRQVEGST